MAETVVASPVTSETQAPVDPSTATTAANPIPSGKPGERMFKVVVDGKEQILPESKIIERAQKGMAAEKDMAEAAKYRQAFDNFVAQSQDPTKLVDLMTNPKALGYDEAKQVALMQAMLSSKNPVMVQAIKKWLYDNEVEPATLTPEQRKLRELEAFKLDSLKREEAMKLENQTAKEKADTERFFNEYRQKIWAGIQAEKLPQSELMVARITRKVQLMRKSGMPADIAKASQLVRQDLIAEYNDQLGKLDDDNILTFLPPGIAERINKAFLKKLNKEEPEVSAKGQPKAKGSAKGPNLNDQLRQISRGRRAF